MPKHTLVPAHGFTPSIGFYVAELEEVREESQHKGQILMLKRLMTES